MERVQFKNPGPVPTLTLENLESLESWMSPFWSSLGGAVFTISMADNLLWRYPAIPITVCLHGWRLRCYCTRPSCSQWVQSLLLGSSTFIPFGFYWTGKDTGGGCLFSTLPHHYTIIRYGDADTRITWRPFHRPRSVVIDLPKGCLSSDDDSLFNLSKSLPSYQTK